MFEQADPYAEDMALLEPAASRDRREGQRYKTVLRVAKLVTARGEELCVIRNISSGGLMAHVYSRPAVGESVTVEVKSGRMLPGTVRWTRDDVAGLQFDEVIDVDQVLGQHGEQGQVARSPRLGVDVRAMVRCGVVYRPVTLCDISQGGVKVRALPWMQPGCEVVLRLPDLPPQTGTVRWRTEEHAGIAFITPISLKTLAGWLSQLTG